MSINDDLENDFLHHVSSHTALVTIAVVLVALRIFVKLRIVRNIGPEDFALIFALICSLVFTAFFIRDNHFARKGLDLTAIEERLKCVYAGGIVYNLSLAFTKTSFLLQYLRIFHYKSMRLAIFIIFLIVVIYSTWGLFRSIIPCQPISDVWKPSALGTSCVNVIKYYTAHSALGVATDVFILLLPIPGLRKLMLPRSQKLGLILVFMLGGFTCVASSLRLSMLVRATDGVLFTRWAGNSIGNWSAIEMNVAIMCCCLPPLRPLAARLWRKLRQSWRIESSQKLNLCGMSGLSNSIGLGRLSSIFLSSKSNTWRTTPSRSDNESPGEYVHTTKSKGSDGTISSNTNTNDMSIFSKSVPHPASDHDDFSHTFESVAINTSVTCSSACFNAAMSDTLGHNSEKMRDPYQQIRNHQDTHISPHHECVQDECKRSSISWLSITETMYDECQVDTSVHEWSRSDAYDPGFPGRAV